MTLPAITRRSFTAAALAGGGALALDRLPIAQAKDSPAPVAFFFVSDTHYLANKESPGELAENSADITSRFIETLNRLPGEAIPDAAGGGKVLPVQGVIHGGDLIDSGDKNGGDHGKMAQTEWDAFTKHYGVTGKDGALKYPVYEVYGNHDGPQARGVAIDGIRERNKSRVGAKAVSKSGLHYSWDWGDVHFVNLGIVVASTADVARKRRYNAEDSYAFLVEDLKEHVGKSGRPVVLTHHIDIARHTSGCDASAEYASKEWDSCDVAAYYKAIAPYNVAAVLYGHTHARQVHTWDGMSMRAERGLSVFNVDNSSHFHGNTQSFFYFELHPGELVVRECRTTDRWQTADWSPEVWRKKLA